MVFRWQLWLSPRPQRTETPAEGQMFGPEDSIKFDYTYHDDGRFVVKETHYANSEAVRAGRSGPPLHIHLRQTEYFKVLQGKLGAIKNEKEVVITKNDAIFVIPPGSRHRFWAKAPVEEDLVFEVWTLPQDLDPSFDEKFLRNFVGYVRDCVHQKINLSIFQVCLIGLSGDTLMICPPFWVPIWILKCAQFVLGYVVGGLLLGYKSTYPEYDVKPRQGLTTKKAQ